MNDWFKNWFASEEYLNVYRHRNDDDAGKLTDLIISQIKLERGSTILDAACGAGRHALNLQAAGYSVTGFDLSKTLLKIASHNAALKNLEPNFFCADLRNVQLKKRFDLIVNLFTSFGYFESDEENFLFARSAYEFLNLGSYYVLDFLNSVYVAHNLVPESERIIGEKKITEKRRIFNGRVEKEIIIESITGANRFKESVRLYSKDDIVKGFQNAGFRAEKIMGDYSGSNFEENSSERLIIFFKR